jgi:hypothetical protein
VERIIKKGGVVKGRIKGVWYLVDFKQDYYGYKNIGIDGKKIKIHRLIAYCFLGLKNINGKHGDVVIDHINGVKTDNRVDNLRIVTQQKNCENRRSKGYHKIGKKWRAQIKVNKKKHHLGYFDTEQEAYAAYLDAKAIHHII